MNAAQCHEQPALAAAGGDTAVHDPATRLVAPLLFPTPSARQSMTAEKAELGRLFYDSNGTQACAASHGLRLHRWPDHHRPRGGTSAQATGSSPGPQRHDLANRHACKQAETPPFSTDSVEMGVNDNVRRKSSRGWLPTPASPALRQGHPACALITWGVIHAISAFQRTILRRAYQHLRGSTALNPA